MTNSTPELSAERARTLLAYDAETGIFAWKISRGSAKAGTVAGSLNALGYSPIGVDGIRYYAHRLAFLIQTGAWPQYDVDHINGVCSDNRWSNLRDVTVSTNLQNQRAARADSSTGLLGASPNKGGFVAQIQVDGRNQYLGTFLTAEQAHAAYLSAKRQNHIGCTI